MEKETIRKGSIPWLRVLLLCSLWLMSASKPASAQLGTATISGNVTDPTGAIVVGASVTAVNNATGFRRQTTSNELGQYNLPGLTPGSYSLTVEFTGFRRAELRDITCRSTRMPASTWRWK